MINLAGHVSPDPIITDELAQAGIEAVHLGYTMQGEVRAGITGRIGRHWHFTRAWSYWIAEGPGIPPDAAERLHAAHGKVVRVEGHCAAPSPSEYLEGFAVGLYHIDTQEGLIALADTIKAVWKPRPGEGGGG